MPADSMQLPKPRPGGWGLPEVSRIERTILPWLAALGFLLLWSIWARGGSGGATDFPTPLETARGFEHLFKTPPGGRAPLIVQHVVSSVYRTTFGFLAAVALGVPLGIFLGWSARAHTALNWLVQLLRPISPIAWIPIAIMMFHGDELRSIYLIFYAAFFSIAVSTSSAVQSIPTVYLRAARNFGLGTIPMLQRVIFPAALPQIVLSLRVSAGICWIVVVAAEMVAVKDGLGWLIIDARYQGARTDLIVGTMLIIGVIGVCIDMLLRRLERLPQVSWGYPPRG